MKNASHKKFNKAKRKISQRLFASQMQFFFSFPAPSQKVNSSCCDWPIKFRKEHTNVLEEVRLCQPQPVPSRLGL